MREQLQLPYKLHVGQSVSSTNICQDQKLMSPLTVLTFGPRKVGTTTSLFAHMKSEQAANGPQSCVCEQLARGCYSMVRDRRPVWR